MTNINVLFVCLLLAVLSPVFCQKNEALEVQKVDLNEKSQRSDSAESARKAYEERLKQAEAFRKGMEKDPKRFMDSLNAIRKERLRLEALERIASYKSNPELASLKEIDISNAQLSHFPSFILEAKNVVVLILDGNSFTKLPTELSRLKSLKRIYWRNNDFNSKMKFPRLEGIEKLDISGNNLKKLPKVHRLKGLEELVLENNDFAKVPTWRGRRLKSLKELDLSKNPVVLNRRWYWLLKDIEVLRLNKCGIENLHHSLYKMRGMKELLIQMNELKGIPYGISGLENLTKLSFYKNDLKTLPSDLFDLQKLKVIDLYYNSLEKIPVDIGKLDSLSILYLSFNSLYDIPKEIGELRALEELYIHHNRISELPSSLGNLDQLKVFHFQHNYVPSFPQQVLEMEALEDLDISDTDITEIPAEITDLPLKTLFWRHLNINLNDPDLMETREVLMKLIEKGTNVVPSVNLQEASMD